MINTREVRAQRSGGSSSRTSGGSTRRCTEQELEIARLREEARQRDEYLKYYAAVMEQQGMLRASIIDYLCLLVPFNIIHSTNIFG